MIVMNNFLNIDAVFIGPTGFLDLNDSCERWASYHLKFRKFEIGDQICSHYWKKYMLPEYFYWC